MVDLEGRPNPRELRPQKHLTCPTKTREALKICSYSLLLDGFGWLLPYIRVHNKRQQVGFLFLSRSLPIFSPSQRQEMQQS
ncbi:hypothetical protein CsSME_00042924 [Camellia sinensis var. sinensis]